MQRDNVDFDDLLNASHYGGGGGRGANSKCTNCDPNFDYKKGAVPGSGWATEAQRAGIAPCKRARGT